MRRLPPPAWPALVFLLLIPRLPAETLLVLPFSNLTKDASLNWIGESVCENVADALSAEGLLVLDREDRQEALRRMSLRQYAVFTRATVFKVGESLDATYVIHGQFSVSPEEGGKRSIRLNGRVMDLARFRQSAEFSRTAPLEDLASLQVALAWDCFRFLRPDANRSETGFKSARQATRIDAMENYIRGLLAPAEDQRHRLFALAARLDPNYSQPRFQLGRLQWKRKNYESAADWLRQVLPSDPHFRQANFLLGLCRYQLGDFASAEAAFSRLATEFPLNEVFNNLGAALARRDSAGALEYFRKALAGDDSDPTYHFNVGYALWRQGDFAAAADRFRAVLERDPQDAEATLMLGRCLKQVRPRAGDPRGDPGPRLKRNFDETAYLQLKEVMQPRKP